MVTSLVVVIVVLIVAALNLRHERREFEALMSECVIDVYLAPEACHSLYLDVFSEEALALKENAQWN